MGRLYLVYLEGKIYSCRHCQTHLALSDDIVSKSFHCRHGKAYLFSKVAILGWKYEAAHEKNQKYKEGKFILERVKVTGPDGTSYWVSPEAQVVGSDGDDA